MVRSSTRSSLARRRQFPSPARPPPSTSTPAHQPLFVVGRGNLGRSLARAFNAAGRRAELRPARKGVPGLVRSLRSGPDAIVFLAVPDDALVTLAEQLAGAGRRIPETVAFVHLSGALPLNALEPLRARHSIGSFHPLQSFPEPRSPAALGSIVVAVDATSTLLRRRLTSLARALGARPKRVGDGERVLYHAAAVFASNYVDVLLAKAVQLLETTGWSEKEATSGLLALTEGVLASIRERGAAASLTGSVPRGDVETIERYLSALAELAGSARSRCEPPLVDLYRMLGLIALEIAVEAGIEPAAAERTRRALTPRAAATRRRRRA